MWISYRINGYVGEEPMAYQQDAVFCCDEMERAWKDRYIGLGNDDCFQLGETVNIYHVDVFPEGSHKSHLAITFCPFCAEKVETEDVTDSSR